MNTKMFLIIKKDFLQVTSKNEQHMLCLIKLTECCMFRHLKMDIEFTRSINTYFLNQTLISHFTCFLTEPLEGSRKNQAGSIYQNWMVLTLIAFSIVDEARFERTICLM